VRVFDTDGLFTPPVVRSGTWLADGTVDEDLLHAALDRPVAMTELIGVWNHAVHRARFFVRASFEPFAPGEWSHLRARAQPRPSPDQVLARYQHALSRMPQSHYSMTLYGEAVGAALERRTQLVQANVEANREPRRNGLPPDAPGAGAVLDEAVELLGCEARPTEVSSREPIWLRCDFRALRRIDRDYAVFVHIESPSGRFLADHAPVAGQRPTSGWRPQEHVRDVFPITPPENAPPGSWQVWVGLFDGDHRAHAEPAELTDGEDRVRGPIITIR
jgi:hypothetical protein